MLSEIINSHYDSFNQTDFYIIKAILSMHDQIEKMGIEELAKKCNTSKSSIMRLTQKLGFSGYSEFKNYVKWENHQKETKSVVNIFDHIKDDFQKTILQVEDSTKLEMLTKKIKNSKQIILYGTGQAQRYCAMEMQRLFMLVNKHMYYIGASDEFRLTCKNLDQDDLVIILSLSGNVKKIKETLQILKLNNVEVASITNMQNNELSGLSDYRLYAVSSPMEIENGLIHNSFINFFVIVEYLFRNYVQISKE